MVVLDVDVAVHGVPVVHEVDHVDDAAELVGPGVACVDKVEPLLGRQLSVADCQQRPRVDLEIDLKMIDKDSKSQVPTQRVEQNDVNRLGLGLRLNCICYFLYSMIH